MRKPRFIGQVTAVVLATLLIASLLSLAAPPLEAQTTVITQTCTTTPSTTPSSVTQAGTQGAVAGEAVTFSNETLLGEGEYFQQAIARPTGETHFTSLVELVGLDDLSGIDASSVSLLIDGVNHPLVPGSAPHATDWVLSATTDGSRTIWQAFFPGDPSTAADENGAPSLTVPVGETLEIALVVSATVPAASIPGAVLAGVECFSRTSTGDQNHDTARSTQPVAVVKPFVILEKTTNVLGGRVTEGSQFSYTLEATVPVVHPDDPSLTVPGAHDLFIIDDVPPGVTPLDEFGVPLTDGGTIPGGGTWDEATNTVTFDVGSLAPGETASVSFNVMVNDTVAPDDGIYNVARLTYSGLPGAVPGEFQIENTSPSGVTLTGTTSGLPGLVRHAFEPMGPRVPTFRRTA